MKKKITIASYNIQHGFSSEFHWEKLALHISECGADIVGLQEVDMFTSRIGGVDALSLVAKAADMPYYTYTPAILSFDGGQYGTAILSKFPIKEHQVIPLPSANYEPRSCSHSVIDMNSEELHFINTHLSFESDEQRKVQFNFLSDIIPYGEKYFVTGDFNTEFKEDFTPVTREGLALANLGHAILNTFRDPASAIDNILYPKDKFSISDMGMADSADSDHNLLFCRFEYM